VRLCCALFLLASVAAAQSGRPRHNASFVPDDDETIRGLMAQARAAAESGEADEAAARLHAMLQSDRATVVALKGREVFVSPRRWATLQLLSGRAPFGPEVLAAWRAVHDRDANSALRGAIVSGDGDAIAHIVARYPAATAVPAALLALSDRALQHGDRDGAHGYLMRVIEHVAASVQDAWLASPAYRDRARHLAALPRRHMVGWPTIGGDWARARNGDALPEAMSLRWQTPILEQVPPTFEQDEQNSWRRHSPILPFYPVADKQHLYVHVGGKVAILDRKTGKRVFYAPDGPPPAPHEVDYLVAHSPGVRAATVQGGILYFNRVLFQYDEPRRRNALIAFDVKRRQVKWALYPGTRWARRRPELFKRNLFFRGAPAVVDGRVYVYGAVRAESAGGPSRKEEAHLLCLSASDGTLLWHRFLGYGDTEAAPSLPPQSGLAPAVASGVVVVVTGLGVAASLDARSGEILWLFRYNRKPIRERERLTEWTEEQVHVGPGWFREPPRIVGDTVYFTPFDSDDRYACWLRGSRRPDGSTAVVQWNRGRNVHPRANSLLEYFAGIHRGRAFFVGRRDKDHSKESYQTVISHAVSDEVTLAYGRIPATSRDEETGAGVPPEVFGRPTIAGSVLLVPTASALFRFDVGRAPSQGLKDGEISREVPPLAPFSPTRPEVAEGTPPAPLFGTLVAIDGFLYAVTADRILCYGALK